MKFFSVIILMIVICISSSVKAQKFTDAKKYWEAIDNKHSKVARHLLAFSNAVSTNEKAATIASLSKTLLTELNKEEIAISAMPAFQNNKAFRDSAAIFMKNCFNLLNIDYGKIATAQPATENSFDKMKDQLAAKVAAIQKLKAANVAYDTASLQFSTKFVTSADAYSNKFQQAATVNIYYNKIYLLYFKTYNAEFYLLDAIKKRDGNSVAQNKKIVNQDAQDGLKQLDTTAAFNNDDNLVKKCQAILNFYSDETDQKMDAVSDYFTEAKDFQKTRSEYERNQSHTKDQVKEYEKAVNQFNKSLGAFNKAFDRLNHKRQKALKKWNHAIKKFFGKHLPT